MTTTFGRRAGRGLALGVAGGLLLALLVPGTAQAITGVSAPTIAGDPDTATVGLFTDFSFTVTGGPTPTCAVTAGALPAGLELGAGDCRLTGTPTEDGVFPFTVTASNGTAPDAARTTTLEVLSAPALTDVTVPRGTAGEPFSYQLPVVGNPSPTVAWGAYDALPDGLTLDPDGLIHGTPTQLLTLRNVGIVLTNSVDSRAYTLQFAIDPQRPQITSGDPAEVVAGRPYAFLFTAAGVPAPTFSVEPSTLPPGFDLDEQTGVLSGTTVQLGDFPITLVATNSLTSQDQRTYTLHVVSTPLQVTNTPPSARVDDIYDFVFDIGQSFPRPTFTVESGTLPTGISLYSQGELYGRPSQVSPGTPVTILVSNGVDPDLHLTVTIPVSPSALTISGTPTSPAAQSANYYFRYRLTGKPAPTVSVTDGALPPGLVLSGDGYLTGNPSTPGTYTFTVTAGNGGASPSVSTTNTIVVPAQVGVAGTPPAGTVGRAYSFAFDLSGTPAPRLTLATPGGPLPPGLTLQADGRLTGTPTQAGTFSFGVLADNGFSQVVKSLSITVTGGTPTVTVADSSRVEGNSGTRAMTFTLTLSSPSTRPVTVHWATANGTARAGSDYAAASGTVTFAAGQTVKTVTVTVRGDRTREPSETFHLRLSRPAGATIADGDALGRIVNDD